MDTAALTMYFTQYGGIAIFVIVFLEYLMGDQIFQWLDML